jgi:hypothetical protein
LSAHTTTTSPGLAHASARTYGVDLVEHDVDGAAADAPAIHRLTYALDDQRRDGAALAAAQRTVLADDHGVEVLGRDLAELADVLVATVARGGRPPRGSGAASRRGLASRSAIKRSTKSPIARMPCGLWQ